jgi:hypothetical protein
MASIKSEDMVLHDWSWGRSLASQRGEGLNKRWGTPLFF